MLVIGRIVYVIHCESGGPGAASLSHKVCLLSFRVASSTRLVGNNAGVTICHS